MFTIDVGTAIGIIVSGLAAFWGLIKYLRSADLKALEQMWRRVEVLERKTQEYEVKAAEAAIRVSTAEEYRRRIEEGLSKLETTRKEDIRIIFGDIKELKETHGDIREAIAGFGANYVSRKEYLDDRLAKKHAS